MDRFVLNERSGLLHTLPAGESCNVDAIADHHRKRAVDAGTLRQLPQYRRDCLRCFT